MITVIGLGETGCSLAKKFKQYPQYSVYKFSLKEGNIQKQISPEMYESNPPDVSTIQKEENILFIVSGNDEESSASLSILENFKEKNIEIFYIRNNEYASERELLHDKVVFRILQEYTRSGLFQRMYLTDVEEVDKILGQVKITEFLERRNNLLCSTYHMTKVFSNSVALVGNISELDELNRITTFSIIDVDSGEEKSLFSIQKPQEIIYLYVMNKETLETDNTILNKIKTQTKQHIEKNIKVMYGVYETDYDTNYGYCLINTKMIQEET